MKSSLTFLSLILAPLAASAQTSDQHPAPTEELVVIGQPIDSLLDSDDLARKQANDLDDVFSGLSSVLVGGSVGAAQKIYVRNLGEDTLNITVDGATQSGVTYHHTGRITIEPELLKRVQVQVGAGDATNGPGALGGAIRFETKDPADLLGGEALGALVKTGAATNTNGAKHSATVYGQLGDGLGAMGSFVSSDQDNMTDAEGEELTGTNSEQTLAFGKVVSEFGRGHRLSLSQEQLREEGDKLMRPEWGEGPRNPLRHLEFERKTSTLDYQWAAPGNDAVELDTTVYLTDFDIYRPHDNYTSAVESRGFTFGNTSELGGHAIEYGVDYRDDEVIAGERGAPDPFVETSEVTGLFVQDRYQVTEALLLSLGSRYDAFEAVDRDGNTFAEEGFSPNIGFSFDATGQLTVSGGYAEALRGVETNDGFKLFDTSNDPDLEAERAKNIELGVDYEIGRLVLSAGAHDVTVENAIGNEVPWSRHYENLGDLESDGYTLGLTYTGPRLYSKWTFLDTTAELDGEQVTRYAYGYLGTTTGETLSVNTSWSLADGVDVGWIATLVEGVDDIYVESADATVDKPGYGVHDFYLSLRPVETLSLDVTVKNAFGKQYLDHGSIEDFTHVEGYEGIVGYPAPGRDIRMTLSLRF